MTGLALSVLLIAAALAVAPGPVVPRSRLRGSTPSGREPGLPGHPLRPGAGHGARLGGLGTRIGGVRTRIGGERLVLAGAWDLLAACLRAGLPIPVAVLAVAEGLDAPVEPVLRRTAELIALGAEPEQAWQPALACSATERLGRIAWRSSRSGAALAESLTRLAGAERAAAREQCETRAQRAGVLIAGPLGLCFLPAFLAVGVVPVVIGLAAGMAQQW